MRPGIEVVICTHNGASRLPATLRALARQTLPAGRWSVLLVDNASTDDTVAVARSVWSRPEVALRVVREVRPGQMSARLRAQKEVAREFICFCDDDNALAADYLATALKSIERMPGVGVMGGRGVPVTAGPLPGWFEVAAFGYAVGAQAESEGEIPSSRGFVYGAGMILRTTAWRQLVASGFTSRLKGREGARISSGDDNELCLALSLLGWRIHYSPKLVFDHHLAPHRFDEAYCRALFHSFGDASVVLNAYRDFVIGRARAKAWKRCAFLRLGQAFWLRLRASFSPRPATTLDASALAGTLSQGLAEAYWRSVTDRSLFPLYHEISDWLAVARAPSAG